MLHDAARRNDKRLVEILLANGADPIRRDRKGKLPFEITKDQEIRQMLRTTNPASKPTSSDRSPNEKPYQKGYLKKWTNYARGSKLRWFILDGITLSYYKSPGKTPGATRPHLSRFRAGGLMDGCRRHTKSMPRLDEHETRKTQTRPQRQTKIRNHQRRQRWRPLPSPSKPPRRSEPLDLCPHPINSTWHRRSYDRSRQQRLWLPALPRRVRLSGPRPPIDIFS